MGVDSIEYDNKYQYQALLETTSYFWASKGGRGSLLEKIIASLGNSYSKNGATLYTVISMLMARSRNDNRTHHKNQDGLQWSIESNIKKLKFDLINIIDNRLIILELKNRVDSGGTAAREEALSKKFLNICRTIESGEKIFVYQGRDRDFVEMLSILGINKVEMNLGFLFNINGKEATLEGDRLNGFYSSSKTHMKNYLKELDHNITKKRFYIK